MKKRIIGLTFFAVASVFIISCNKKFDAPPTYVTPNITANKTIAAFKSVYTTTGTVVPITDSSIISGIVVANDSSGNIYKEIFIEDPSGGLMIKLNGTNLYGSYPVGMQIFIKCNGLALSDYNGNMELGAIDNTNPSSPAIADIPSTLFTQYIVAGNTKNPIVPKVVTLAQLSAAATVQPYLDTLQNTLVEIDNAEFASTDTGLVYSDTSQNKGNVQRHLEDCPGGKTILYTSGYADFAGVKLVPGNGSIVAMCTPYKGTSELILRDTSDVKFTNARCNGGGNSNGGLITVAALRAMYTGSTITIANSTQITGVVISDASNKNISAGDVIIQQGNSGISVYFGGTIKYNLGDSVVIDVTGGKLQSYNGSLEIATASSTQPAAVATGKNIVPQVTTIAQLTANLSTEEFTLVEIDNATVTSTGTFSGNKTFTDASGTMTLYTAAGATFSGTTMPTTAHTWIGYGSFFNTTKQLQIRNLNDIQP